MVKLRVRIKQNGQEQFCSEWEEGVSEDQIEMTVARQLETWRQSKFSSLAEYLASLPDIEEEND